MTDPTTGAAGWLASKLAPPLFGLVGAVMMLLYTREADHRRMVVAVVAGMVLAYVLPPILMGYARSVISWLPADGSVEGLLGFLLGLAAIGLVGWWLKVSRNPDALLNRGGGEAK